jgi:ketosteroid isomerase-like protein
VELGLRFPISTEVAMAIADAPAVVARYLTAAAADDVDTLLGCFTDDAEVVDEDESFHGHEEIRRWRRTVASKFTYTVEVIDAQARTPDDHVVTTRLEGNFPGSPVELTYHFVLRDGLVSRLVIAP